MAKDKTAPPPQQNAGSPEEDQKPQTEQADQKKPKTPKVAAPKIDPDLLTDEKVDDLIAYLESLKVTPKMRLKRTLMNGLLKSLRDEGYDDEQLPKKMAERLNSLENEPGIRELLKEVETMIKSQSSTKNVAQNEAAGEQVEQARN